MKVMTKVIRTAIGGGFNSGVPDERMRAFNGQEKSSDGGFVSGRY